MESHVNASIMIRGGREDDGDGEGDGTVALDDVIGRGVVDGEEVVEVEEDDEGSPNEYPFPSAPTS